MRVAAGGADCSSLSWCGSFLAVFKFLFLFCLLFLLLSEKGLFVFLILLTTLKASSLKKIPWNRMLVGKDL